MKSDERKLRLIELEEKEARAAHKSSGHSRDATRLSIAGYLDRPVSCVAIRTTKKGLDRATRLNYESSMEENKELAERLTKESFAIEERLKEIRAKIQGARARVEAARRAIAEDPGRVHVWVKPEPSSDWSAHDIKIVGMDFDDVREKAKPYASPDVVWVKPEGGDDAE